MGDLKKSLDEAQIEGLLLGDDGFEKARVRGVGLYPHMDLNKMEYFKVVQITISLMRMIPLGIRIMLLMFRPLLICGRRR